MAPLSGLPSLKVSEMWNLLGWPNAAEHMDLRQGLLAEVKRILSRGGWRTHLDLSDEDFKDVLQTIFLLPQLPYRFQRKSKTQLLKVHR